MKSRAWLGAAAAVAIAVGGALWMARGDVAPAEDTQRERGEDPPAFDALALRWTAGERHVIEVDYRTASTTDVGAIMGPSVPSGAASLQGDVRIAARLGLDVVETYDDGAMRARLSVLDAGASTLTFNGEAVAEFAAQLDGASVWVALGACGDVREIGAASAGMSLGAEALRTFVQDSRFAVCDLGGAVAAWRAVEASPHGLAEVRYTRDTETRVERTLVAMPRLNVADGRADDAALSGDGFAEVRDGALASMAWSERIAWHGEGRGLDAETSLTWRLVSRGPVEVAYADGIVWTAPDTRPLPVDAERALRERRAEGVSAAQVVERVVADLEDDGAAFREFMWRAPARVALDADAVVPELVTLATAADASTRQTALALDLLAQADHDRATAGLVDALRSDALAGRDQYGLFLQRAGFVEDPTPDLIDLLLARSESPDADTAWSARYALGSVVASLDATGSDEGDAYHSRLSQGLSAAAGEERAHYLRALANAERIADLPTFAAHTTSASPAVRAAAAMGLKMLPSRLSLVHLVPMVGDESVVVQQAAMTGLHGQPLQPGDLEPLVALVSDGRVGRRSESTLVGMLTWAVAHDRDGALAVADALHVATSDARVIAALRDLRTWAEAN